ncbi:MAG: PIG-L family deacetylase [Planctomycetaceae bacterium]|nr:PIG-L family deacetylase [Planctomycetaceae bacterium]
MNRIFATILVFAVSVVAFGQQPYGGTAPDAQIPEDGKLRIICFGAHPDDAEFRAGGSAVLWGARGDHVLLVSVTNGDIGHWFEAGGVLANRRYREAQEAAKILGTTTLVWDIHDGELEPNLENRRRFTREIRRWNADVVIGHRPNDYHPDHRYTGVLMQDSAYMVGVPFLCPDVPPLQKTPIFLYSYDSFQKPNPFTADIVVAIDDAMDKKMEALMRMESQFVEGGALGYLDPQAVATVTDVKAHQEQKKRAEERFRSRTAAIADQYREKLIELYGEVGKKVKYAEAFEICEYGRRPTLEEILKIFPISSRNSH